jgi:hypothetical protein
MEVFLKWEKGSEEGMLDFSRGKKVYFIVDLCICEYIEHDYIVIIGSSISFFLLIIIL